MTDNKIRLSDCGPHGSSLHRPHPIRFKGKLVVSPGKFPTVQNYEFVDCEFQGDIDGFSFDDCTFRNCRFIDGHWGSVYFWGSRFIDCVFTKGSWVHIAFREVKFEACTFNRIDLEAGAFLGCTFENVTWDVGSITSSCFEYCALETTSFNETVVHAVLRDCNVCDAAFDHIVEDDASCITFCSSGGGVPSLKTKTPKGGTGLTGAASIADKAISRNVRHGKGQDPLQAFEVTNSRPTRAQLRELDDLLRTETAEKPFQLFLEANPQLLTLAVELGHHGLYVLSEVRFGSKHRADFMIGAKNSMGHFWTGLEIESPRHKVLKANGHFTQKVQHAIDQVLEWRNYVRTNRATVQRPKSQRGEGLVGIEPEFKAWIIIGRDPENLSSRERRARFLDSTRNIHVQTWDGFRNRVAAAVHGNRKNS